MFMRKQLDRNLGRYYRHPRGFMWWTRQKVLTDEKTLQAARAGYSTLITNWRESSKT
jgi:hypothetical protein